MPKKKRKNSISEFIESEEAKSIARGFHGRDNESESNEEIEEIQETDLAQLGELVEFEIYSSLGKVETMSFSRVKSDDIVKICCNVDRTQLYLIGGDTFLSDEILIKNFGIENTTKNKVSLGYVITISYFADKHHLTGPKQQKYGIEYIHSFGEGKIKVNTPEARIAGGVVPELIYDIRNECFELIGGDYYIKDVGIWN